MTLWDARPRGAVSKVLLTALSSSLVNTLLASLALATSQAGPSLPHAGRSMSRENWVGLESNPEVLTQYAHKLGGASRSI